MDKKIQIYNAIFWVLISKLELVGKKNSENSKSQTNLESCESSTSLNKSSLPIMNQDEFISFWRIVYNLFTGLENEAEMYHAAATVSTLLLKLGEASRKFQEDETRPRFNTESEDSEDIKKSRSSSMLDTSSKIWCITFEQLIASLLTDNLLVNYFDAKFDIDKKLGEYKSQHA